MTPEQIRSRVQEDEVDYILAQWVDIHGTPRCKGVPARRARPVPRRVGRVRRRGDGRHGPGPAQPRHGRHARPRLLHARPVGDRRRPGRVRHPGGRRGVALLLADGAPTHALERLAAIGYEMRVGVGGRAHARDARRADGSDRAVRPGRRRHAREALLRLQGAVGQPRLPARAGPYLEQLGWEPYASDHEDGTAQFELNWKYADALTTADRYTFFKMMTNQVAQRHGAIATHMPKPFAHLTGNGSHFHFSLWDATAANAVPATRGDPRGLGQSQLAYQFLGGLIDARPGARGRHRADRQLLQAPLDRATT